MENINNLIGQEIKGEDGKSYKIVSARFSGATVELKTEEVKKMISNKKVILNIGHGNTINKKGQKVYDPGAVENGQEEYKYNFDLVNKYIAPYLKSKGIKCEVIIQSVRFSQLPAEINAISTKDDIIVSFHLNSADTNTATGVETFYYPTSAKGRELAQVMLEANLKVTKLRNRGIKTNEKGARGHALFEGTKGVAILVESGFISNPNDLAALNAVMGDLGKSYADAIIEYLNKN